MRCGELKRKDSMATLGEYAAAFRLGLLCLGLGRVAVAAVFGGACFLAGFIYIRGRSGGFLLLDLSLDFLGTSGRETLFSGIAHDWRGRGSRYDSGGSGRFFVGRARAVFWLAHGFAALFDGRRMGRTARRLGLGKHFGDSVAKRALTYRACRRIVYELVEVAFGLQFELGDEFVGLFGQLTFGSERILHLWWRRLLVADRGVWWLLVTWCRRCGQNMVCTKQREGQIKKEI